MHQIAELAPLPHADESFAFEEVIDEICQMAWETLDSDALVKIAKAYYYFSIQFRENLEIACLRHPDDHRLQELSDGECNTDNLSPYPGVTAAGEKLNHDEFMRRLLSLRPVADAAHLERLGLRYLRQVRAIDRATRAVSIASYEDGGLSRVFAAMLRARQWRGPAPQAFKFFLEEHIRFDLDEGGGHGALSRHLRPNDAILPLWTAFRDLLAAAAPALARPRSAASQPRREPAYPLPAASL